MEKNEMSDEEVIIQYIKIFLAVVIGMITLFTLYHLHMDNLRMEQNQLKMIKIMENEKRDF